MQIRSTRIQRRQAQLRVLGSRRVSYSTLSFDSVIFLDLFVEILAYAPNKVERTKLLLRAFSDGWHGRLGKTVDPAAYMQKSG
jgi:hypothetical protein